MTLQEVTTSDRLLEREKELDAIRRALAQTAQGTGSLLAIDGPAGVGKTALLDAARGAAADADLLVLRARGAELEQAFGFGIVRQLFDEVLRSGTFDPATLFTGAARFAGPLLAVELDGVTAVPADDPFAARHALYWLTANLAAQTPLAILVDDGHWADTASLGALAYIANRLEGMPAALILASRSEESLPALDALRRQAGAHGTVLHVPSLGAEAAAVVVRTLAPTADDALCREIHEATGGNPFLLGELARSMLAGERNAMADQSPERVTREIAARLARLPEPAGQLARAAAVLGNGAALREATALAGTGDAEAAEAADALVSAGVLRSTQPLEFLHPLVGAAVYAGLGTAARSHDHARAARLLDSEAASPERVAAQLLRCQPAGDEWAYERLVSAARLAWARGATDAVATYLQRALDEPAPPERRSELLLELGVAEAHADFGAAVAHIREALAGELDAERRFRATLLLAGVLGQTGQAADAADVLEEQFDAFPDRPDLRGQMEAALANVTRINAATRPRAARAIESMRRRVESGEERDPAVLGTIAAEMGMAGDPIEAMAPIAERAVVGIEATAMTAEGWSWYNAVRSLVVSEQYDAARRSMDLALARARERGAVLDVGGVLTFRSELSLHVGDLASAEVDARTLGEISDVCGWPLGAGFSAAWLGEVLIDRGELEEADRLIAKGPFAGPPATVLDVYPSLWLLLARARLRLAQGRAEDAEPELRECARRAEGMGHFSPAVAPWRSWLARALTELGQTAEARRLAAEELERARACGARRAIGIALCAAARVEGEIGLLREAVEVLDASEAQLERARAHAELGAALRETGAAEDAREPLRVAVDLAHRCGATALEDHALAELRASGARPRRRATTGAGALTPSERRIAELAATGQQNREIAEALFVTTPTVEFHLRNAYRKLRIASRTELAGALSA
jgi:DNA-binding CsgD family transcriptional regulator